MAKNVTRMGKSGEQESYAVKDTEARQEIAAEATAREQAVSEEAIARQQAVSAEATAREQAVEGIQEKITNRDKLMTDAMPSAFHENAISGTNYKVFNCVLPAGDYIVSADSVITEGTGKPRVVFNYRDLTSAQCFLPVGTDSKTKVFLKKEVFEIFVFAGETNDGSEGKNFSISNLDVSSKAIVNLSDKEETKTDYSLMALNINNLFNGRTHNNIPLAQEGHYYGEETELDSYFYTDLIPLIKEKTIYVRAGVSGDAYHYVYYYDINKRYITNTEGRTMGAHSNHPDEAAYFCVSTTDTREGQLVISYSFPAEYYAPNSIKPLINGYAKEEYVRYDRGQIKDWYPNGATLYPMTYNTDICSVVPMPVPESREVRCVTATKYIAVEYYDKYLNKLDGAGEVVNSEAKQLTIPENAAVICAYISDCEPSTYYFVEGTTNIDHVPDFSEKKMSSTAARGSNLFNKRILFIGDSIMAGSLYSGGWPTIIRQQTGAIVNNRAHDGFTVGKLQGRADNLIERLDETTGDYDIIVLSGGYNDLTAAPRAEIGTVNPIPYNDESAYDPYTFAGGIETYIRLARAKWPNAKIVYVLTMRRVWQNATTSSEQLTYWDIIRTACEKWSIPYLDLSRTSMLTGDGINGANDPITHMYYHNDDATHPNTAGYEYIAPQIIHFLEDVVN